MEEVECARAIHMSENRSILIGSAPNPSVQQPDQEAPKPSGIEKKRELHPAVKAAQWKPGQSGNPSGRPPTLQLQISRLTRNGAELLEILLGFARGDIKSTGRDRLEATKTLCDRLWGRAVETSIQMAASLPADGPQSEMAADALEALARALRASSAPAIDSGCSRVTLPAEEAPILPDSLDLSD